MTEMKLKAKVWVENETYYITSRPWQHDSSAGSYAVFLRVRRLNLQKPPISSKAKISTFYYTEQLRNLQTQNQKTKGKAMVNQNQDVKLKSKP